MGILKSLSSLAMAGLGMLGISSSAQSLAQGFQNLNQRFNAMPRMSYRPARGWGRQGDAKLYGKSLSWNGRANNDNPAGTKLGRKAQKQSITIRKGW